jgi:hypothetical protein
MLGNVALASVAVSGESRESGKFNPRALAGTGEVGEDIYGPFEAGFGSQQDNIISNLGCTNPSDGYLDGGIDTYTAERMIAAACDVQLPRWEGGQYISMLDQCGGHTNDYHNHERLICLYDDAASGHSTKVGEAEDGASTGLYGKWEDTNLLPQLDACGAHLGPTPDSNGESVYHYHVQDSPPFTIGCFGPNDDGTLVTVAQCREFYSGCGDGDDITVTTTDGTSQYDLWCPCYDADASNVGTSPLAVFSGATEPEPEVEAEPESGSGSEPEPEPVTGTPTTNSKTNVVLFMPDDMHFFFPEAPPNPTSNDNPYVTRDHFVCCLHLVAVPI